MKKISLIALLSIFVSISSCKKDKDTPKSVPVNYKIKSSTDTDSDGKSTTYDYSYDAEGLLSKITYNSDVTHSREEINLSWSSDKLEIITTTSPYNKICLRNANGYVISMRYRNTSCTYTYNDNNQLVKSTEQTPGSDNATTTYNWSDGNITTKIEKRYDYNNTLTSQSTTTYTYGNTANTLDYGMKFIPDFTQFYHTQKLPTKEITVTTGANSGTSTITYDYHTDGKGRVDKYTIMLSGWIVNSTLTYFD